MKNKVILSTTEYFLILICFLCCLVGAALLSIDQCPDEYARRLVSDWIYRTGTLPTGDEPATILVSWENPNIPGWGFSYALRPYLSALISAFFMKLASLVTGSPHVLLIASRMCSILSITFCCYFCLLLGHKLFFRKSSAILFATIICFMPQVMFLGMYQNNDSLSLCAVSMILFCWVNGYEQKWSIRSCIQLGVSFSIAFLSYYSIYGWILMGAVFSIIAILTDSEIKKKGSLILKRASLVGGICLLLAGWFFIRNAILHNGDFLGLASEQLSREKMLKLGFKLFDYQTPRDQGVSVWSFIMLNHRWWLLNTIASFIGVFGYMKFYLPRYVYIIYFAVTGLGILMFFISHRKSSKHEKMFILMIILSGVLTFLLHFWQSYARDFQPQGRYIISLVLLLSYLIVYGLDKASLRLQKVPHLTTVFTVIWLSLYFWVAATTMTKII